MDNVNKEVVEFYKKLGYTLIEIKSSVFREEESTLVFQTDNKNHTVDGSTILYDHAVAIHHQLQKARGEDIHFRVTNYGTKKVDEMIAEAVQKARHDWLREEIVRLEEEKLEAELHYDMRGMTETKAYCSALQTIIDRYHSELDQPINSIFKE